ncbi:MAG: PAS domain-containing protein [Thermodesulfobacteriota bacterium]|nr:PAS domain-containing protein [Thermodesulfobacteriota bacterium]
MSGISWKNGGHLESLDWKEFSKTLLNVAVNGIVVLDTDGQTVLSNKKAQDTLGLFPGSRLSTTLPAISDAAADILTRKSSFFKIALKYKKKRFLVKLSPLIIKKKMFGLFCFFQDVTDFEHLTERMNTYHKLSIELDTLIDSSNDGLWICDGSGYVLKINAASERLANVKAKDVIGRNMRDLVADGLINHSVTLKVMETRKKASIIQTTRQGKKLLLTGNPVFDKETGEIFRIVVNERDITEITRLQEELQEKSALNEQFKRDMLEMHIEEIESQQIIARTPGYVNIIEKAVKLGRVDSTVLLLGESGTGKGMIAEKTGYKNCSCHQSGSQGDDKAVDISK